MAMVNMNNLLNGKDSRWLQLEVCREFQRNKCSRPDTECKFAHPPANVEVQNGRVTACYDSIKGRCNREKPPCKYFHPPQHLKDQLLINGRNHLALKNAIMQQMGLTPGQPIVPGQVPAVAANPYLTGMPQVGSTYSPYFAPGPIMPAIMGPDPSVASPLGVVPQTVVAQQKMPRSDRLEMDVKSVGSFYYENFYVPQAFSGMMPYKRPAADKSGMPVYQPSATTYQQLMQLQQQPFVPVSCEYTSPPPVPTTSLTAANPATASASSCASPAAGAPAVVVTSAPILQQGAAVVPPSAVPSVDTPVTVATNNPNQPTVSLGSLTSQQQEVVDGQSMVAVSAAPPPLPPPPTSSVGPTHIDAAALAKEVAQQNYAKAVKLAAVSQSYGINSTLAAINYTGVALNKQPVTIPPPAMPRYSALPFAFTGAAGPTPAGLGLTSLAANPYAAQAQAAAAAAASAAQPNLLAFTRPPPAVINPYSLLRTYPTAPGAAAGTPTLLGPHQGLIAAHQYSALAPQVAIPQTPVSVAMPQANNNNVVLQPYKKMKTT